ncbi:hypothetical protein AQS70_20625 [Pseudomonas endophytica]|uniref:Uncharacterized protein n=1 Tax=Pseudomonas endophytica TaxID=1563157 RepID=A0A0Q0YYL8_9PSED|nr:hypothetical protein AQS70_20625 [Pseudomonas endophytica]
MIDTIKTFSMMILMGAAVRLVSDWIDSHYIMRFLDSNLINLQIALLAINTTTAGVVLSRMRELIDKTGANFNLTISAFRKSTCEQIFLIFSSITLLTLINSTIFTANVPHSKTALECLLISVFLTSLYNLYDNAKSIFIIIGYRG